MEATQKRLDLGKYSSSGHVTYYLGDTHEGAANHCDEKLKKAIELIEKDGDAWIGLGDYVDCINHRDPRFNPQEISERYSVKDLEDLPRRQSDHFLSAIAPIKDRCLGLIYGNHEDSYRHHNTFDVVRYMIENMDVPNLRHKAWVSLMFERGNKSFPVKLCVCHGAGGGGMREGYPINKVHDVFKYDMADVHVMGHLHQMAVSRAAYNRYEYGALRQDPVWFAVNGCFLAKSTFGNDGYFEQRPGKESSIGMIKQTIYTSSFSKQGFEIHVEPIYL